MLDPRVVKNAVLLFLYLSPLSPPSQSADYDPHHPGRVRRDGSYIYEEFLTTGGTDVKVYTVGPRCVFVMWSAVAVWVGLRSCLCVHPFC